MPPGTATTCGALPKSRRFLCRSGHIGGRKVPKCYSSGFFHGKCGDARGVAVHSKKGNRMSSGVIDRDGVTLSLGLCVNSTALNDLRGCRSAQHHLGGAAGWPDEVSERRAGKEVFVTCVHRLLLLLSSC